MSFPFILGWKPHFRNDWIFIYSFFFCISVCFKTVFAKIEVFVHLLTDPYCPPPIYFGKDYISLYRCTDFMDHKNLNEKNKKKIEIVSRGFLDFKLFGNHQYLSNNWLEEAEAEENRLFIFNFVRWAINNRQESRDDKRHTHTFAPEDNFSTNDRLKWLYLSVITLFVNLIDLMISQNIYEVLKGYNYNKGLKANT